MAKPSRCFAEPVKKKGKEEKEEREGSTCSRKPLRGRERGQNLRNEGESLLLLSPFSLGGGITCRGEKKMSSGKTVETMGKRFDKKKKEGEKRMKIAFNHFLLYTVAEGKRERKRPPSTPPGLPIP